MTPKARHLMTRKAGRLRIGAACLATICLMLVTATTANAVSYVQQPNYGKPGVVNFSNPASVGAIPSNSTAYINVNGVRIHAVSPNGDPAWTPNQVLKVDWNVFQWHNGAWVPDGGCRASGNVSYLGSYYPESILYGSCHVPVATDHWYTVEMRVGWVQAPSGAAMGAATYWMTATNDLTCLTAYPTCQVNRFSSNGLGLAPASIDGIGFGHYN